MDSNERESVQLGVPLDHVIEDRSDARIGMVIGAIGLVFLIPGIIGVVSGGRSGLIVGGIFGVVGLALVALAAKSLWVRSRWDNPQLQLPSSAPLRLGDQVVARFRRRSRASGGARGATLTAELICHERAVYRQGTDTHSATADVWRGEVAAKVYSGDDQIEADLFLAIPTFEAAPSFDLGNNEVHWRLDVKIAAPEAPDDTATFPLMVGPEVVIRPAGAPS